MSLPPVEPFAYTRKRDREWLCGGDAERIGENSLQHCGADECEGELAFFSRESLARWVAMTLLKGSLRGFVARVLT